MQQQQWPDQEFYTHDEMRAMVAALNTLPLTRFGRPARARLAYATIGTRAEILTCDGCGPVRITWRAAARRLNTQDGTF